MGLRTCPFHGCGKAIDPAIFACKDHWHTMTEKDRKAIWDAYREYQKGTMPIAILQGIQHRIMLHYQTALPSKPLPASQDAIRWATKCKEYIRKRKEYTACKDGFLERKRNLGMELSRLEKQLDDICNEILHPKQTQPTLFDPGEEQKGVPD